MIFILIDSLYNVSVSLDDIFDKDPVVIFLKPTKRSARDCWQDLKKVMNTKKSN